MIEKNRGQKKWCIYVLRNTTDFVWVSIYDDPLKLTNHFNLIYSPLTVMSMNDDDNGHDGKDVIFVVCNFSAVWPRLRDVKERI